MKLENLSEFDRRCLEEAIQLGWKGDSRVHPNPRVGAVIAKEGEVIGRGWHRVRGEAHAEIDAINQSQSSLDGATVYVSLEPCDHHGRTPPCTERLLKEGVGRVVFAMADPGPGQGGAQRLREEGVEVIGPVDSPSAKRLLAPFLTHTTKNRVHLTMKWAMTLDGRIALGSGDSRWVTSQESRVHAHRVRSQVDGIMVGAGTVLADHPSLNVRHELDGPDPRPIIWDPKGRLNSKNVEETWWQSMLEREAIIVSDQGESSFLEVLPWNDGEGFSEALLERGFHHVLVEGGAGLLGTFLDLGLGDDALVYLAPKVCGGKDSLSPVGGVGVSKMDLAYGLKEMEVMPLGPDLLIQGSFE
jgi:diaminohydroxyphosphoribosylaminopyrimidine deaminase / 5-amino-6-(5-phosphoribosylamino)uracil reductase